MGLFDNIKNYVTGGAAEVKLELESATLIEEQVLKLTIAARPTSDTIHAKKLYLEVKALESSSTKNVRYQKDYVVESEIQINEGNEREWTFEVELPPEAPATHIGKHFSLEWGVKAGLDMGGKDPDSGWVRFVLNKEMDYSIKNS